MRREARVAHGRTDIRHGLKKSPAPGAVAGEKEKEDTGKKEEEERLVKWRTKGGSEHRSA